jgi:hypothetical protein
LDKALAQLIITGTYNILSENDPYTKLILKEIGKLGDNLINKEGMEIIILPKDFKLFGLHWGSSRHLRCQGFITATTKPQLNVTQAQKFLPSNSQLSQEAVSCQKIGA